MTSRIIIGCTAVFALLATGSFVLRTGKPADSNDLLPDPLPTKTGSWASQSCNAIAALEDQVVAGSSKERGGDAACRSDEANRLATIDATAARVRLMAASEQKTSRADAIGATLDEVLDPLRRCVGCSEPKEGCASAARALVQLERMTADDGPR